MEFDAVNRFDVYDLPVAPMTKTPEGWLQGKVVVTHTGVFPYRNMDGSIRREKRDASEVFKDQSLESLKNKPMTNEHPSKLLDVKTARGLTVGHLGSTVEIKNDSMLVVDLLVFDEGTIRDIEAGKQALSMGYTTDLVPYNGDEADVSQTNILYNHVALVKKGRAKHAGLRLDSELNLDEDNCQVHCTDLYHNVDKENDNMPELRVYHLDGVEVQADISFIEAYKKLLDANEALGVANKQLKLDSEGEVQKSKAAYDALQEKFDKASGDLIAEKAAHEELKKNSYTKESMAARLKLEGYATKQKCTFDASEDDLSLMKKVVLSVSPKLDLTGKPDAYIQGRYDAAIADIDAGPGGDGLLNGPRIDSALTDLKVISHEEAVKAYEKNQNKERK